MRRTLSVLILIAAAVFVSARWTPAAFAQIPDAPPVAPEPAGDSQYVPGRLIVGIEPGTESGAEPGAEPGTAPSQVADAASIQAATAQVALALAALDAQALLVDDPCLAGPAQPGRVAFQSWQVAAGREEEALALLADQPGLRFAARDVYMYAAQEEIVQPISTDEAQLASEPVFAINDPLYAIEQWGPQRANFPRAWQMLPPNSALTPIRVAVIDSGVDFNHPDLADRLLPGKNYLITETLPIDDNGHGTHVAGIIAAITNNALGMAGSAPKVLIDPRKVLNSSGNGSPINLRYALCDAALDGAQIVNMSVQIPSSFRDGNPTAFRAIQEAIEFAAARGVLLVAAAGNQTFSNNPPQVQYPALFEQVMAVAALTVDNQRAGYSATGPKIEIAAPGGSSADPIVSTWPSAVSVQAKCDGDLVPSAGSWYCGEAGTSMASPYVAGAAALVWSMQPSLSAAEVRAILTETAADVGLPPEAQGAGLLNAEGAVRILARSNLTVAITETSRSVAYGSAPYTVTLVLSNPSLEPLSVTGLLTGSNWLSIGSLGGSSFSTELVYGQPLAMPVVISPTHLVTGTYAGQIQLTASRLDGSIVRSAPTFFVGAGAQLPKPLYFPVVLVGAGPQTSDSTLSFSWETPISPTVYALSATESVDVTLPFAFPLAGQAGSSALTHSQVRIYADGFVTFPDTGTFTSFSTGQNRCLPWSPGGMQGVFGWWADLDATASGAEVSSFRPAADRFVIQYKNMASAGVTPAYRVTFQIVLYRNGDVQLNYGDAPASWSLSYGQLLPYATVGVQARNGLYRNQVACATSNTHVGALPQSGQSLRITGGEVY